METYIEQGKVLLEKKEYTRAIEYFQAAISEDSSCEDAYIKMAESYRIIGKIREADNILNKLLSINPDNKVAIALLHSQTDNYHESVLRRNDCEYQESQIDGEKIFTVNGVSFKMVRVNGGAFQMGTDKIQRSRHLFPILQRLLGNSNDSSISKSDNGFPIHNIKLSNFYIGETVVTQALWEAVMGNDDVTARWETKYGKGAEYPAYRFNYKEALKFIKTLNRKTNTGFRIPTEAEWEYAARGGEKSNQCIYSGSDNLDEVAWYWRNSGNGYLTAPDEDWNWDMVINNGCKTHPVKTKKSNEIGLYDMSGNLAEWCADWYNESYYKKSPIDNPKGPHSGVYRVIRGGGLCSCEENCRLTYRCFFRPTSRSVIGMRIALSLK